MLKNRLEKAIYFAIVLYIMQIKKGFQKKNF